MRWTSPTPDTRVGSRLWRSPRATCVPLHALSSTRTWTRPTSISWASASVSTRRRPRVTCRRCSTRLSTSATTLTSGPGDHDPPDPGPERLRRGTRRHDQLGGQGAGARRADALHGLPSRLEDARPPTDTTADARARSLDRAAERSQVRVRRQRPCSRGRQHPLRRVRRAGDRARLVLARQLCAHRRRPLPGMRLTAAGVFVGRLGSWGPSRLPVRLMPMAG